MLKTIATNLLAGLRLLAPGKISAERFQPSLASASIATILTFMSMAWLDYVQQSGDISFNDYGAAVVGSILFIALLIAVVVARMQSAMDRLPLLLTVLSNAMFWYFTFLCAFQAFAAASVQLWAVSIVVLIWGLAIFVRAIQLSFDAGIRAAAAFAVAAILLALFVFQSRYLHAGLFYSYDPEEYESFSEVDVEDVFYKQPGLVARKMENLLEGRPNEVDMYFVGYAGNGDQPIFAKEVLFAEQVVQKQFATEGRTVSLRNDVDSLDTEPLANRHNLRSALQHVGQLMNADEDVLFLFMTSHGSRDAELDTSLYPFDLQDLSASDVRQYLDESAIQWRIVIVSACYSGSFIDALRDERTLVISASASDRNSFGCSSKRDLTYFGEEFFANQLDYNSDLFDAFAQTAENVRSKEVAEGLTPSEPQIFIGSLIEGKLTEQMRARAAE